jgi:release factor glutamine methyltransferase
MDRKEPHRHDLFQSRTSHATLIAEATEALAQAGIESARFEAQLLLAFALDVPRAALIARTAPDPTPQQQRAFETLVQARVRRVPLAYLRGTQEFYSLPFVVTPATLIPRPESEMLVEFALEKMQNLSTTGASESIIIVDIGTGSGCLAVSIVKNAPAGSLVRAIATDISWEALQIARYNASQNHLADSVRFVQGNLCAGIVRADLIVSNPPYIPTTEIPNLQPEVRDFEPRAALDGGPDGLNFYRRMAGAARQVLRPGGWLAVEVGRGQSAQVQAILRAEGCREVGARQDFAGIERLIYGQFPDRIVP